MLLLHLVPVGLSLLKKGHVEFPDSPLTARQALQHASTGPRHELDWGRLGPAGLPRLAAGLGTDTAAEWTSIAAIRDERRYASVQGEAYLFIATDTTDGLRAATLVAERYQDSAIRYVDEPLAARRGEVLEPGDGCVYRIPDLDLGNLTLTSTTWRSLGRVGRLAADTATQSPRGEWHVILHLSGGYKAMIPYLMVLAEAVHSRLRDNRPDSAHRPSIRAVVIHEDSVGQGSPEPPLVIDVPVRSIRRDLLTFTKKLAAAARPDSDLVDAGVADDLLGLFTEVVEGTQKRRLTSAGLITVSVL
ncbi:MAG: hypothetical protein ACRDT0_14340 [Pseudonocardiaceae bacterium]